MLSVNLQFMQVRKQITNADTKIISLPCYLRILELLKDIYI